VTYEECLQHCIEMFRPDESNDEIETMQAYPIPSSDEWSDVLAATLEFEDADDPLALMGTYEIRLRARGYRTVMGDVLDTLYALAEKAGIPNEHI
jgi:hypothetical protein